MMVYDAALLTTTTMMVSCESATLVDMESL
jgi:hypothetical protein